MGTSLLLALVALAMLQYRWITRASDAERDRLRASLDSSATRFCDGFDRELARVYRSFQLADGPAEGALEGDLASRLAAWRKTDAAAGLVQEILVVTRRGRDEPELRRLDEKSGALVPAGWEPGLDSLRQIFEARGKVPALDERLPGLIFPVLPAPPPAETGPGGERRPPRDEGPAENARRPSDGRPPAPPQADRPPRETDGPGAARRRPPRDHVVVRLDASFLASETLRRLAEREFGGGEGLAYGVTVALAAPPRTVFYQGGPVPKTTASREGDTVRTFFGMPRLGDVPEPGKWTLAIHHPSGSLEDAVAGARRRNLAVSLAILALLGSTIVLLVASTRRAQRLARQQMDFVASISHELRTPLTAMRSAGQNLADGIVDAPEKVRKYGSLIEREGRRLTEMVGRVLTFAGIQSGAQSFQMQPVAVAALVEGVLSDCRWVLEERGVRADAKVAEGLPPVRGDAAALRQALANLVDNALKYGGAEKWIGLTAKAVSGSRGEEVVLSVSDRGIGIRRGDQRHLFEPFFRSSDTASAGITGSGLGLAVVRGIVEAHGGRVTVESVPGKGSTFAIHLPADAAAAVQGARP